MATVFWNSYPKIPNKAFLVPHLSIFVSSQSFAMTLIRRCWFQIWQQRLKVLAQKNQNKTLLVTNLDIFIISQYFVIRQIQGCQFLIWQYFFWILAQKHTNTAFLVKNTQIRHFWSQIYIFLFLHKILQLGKFECADFKYDNSFL